MPLRPVTLDESLIGQALSWDLYTASGVLVAGAGMVIADATQLARLRARPVFRKAEAGSDPDDLAPRLHAVLADYADLIAGPDPDRLEPALRLLARELIALAASDHDAALGLVRLLPLRNPAGRHCLVSALIALDLGELSGLPADALESLVAAALSMNLSAIDLHAALTEGRKTFSPEVRAEIRRHPEETAALLEAAGVTDPLWLAAVREHHENIDGSGYPRGLAGEAIGLPARLIRVADFYTAKISGRHYRPPRTAAYAFKQLFGDERGRLDSHAANLLLRHLGLYPPGTLVRLASRETALVTRKEGDGECAGHATVFMNPRGRLLAEPFERNTAQSVFAVLGAGAPEAHWPEIRWEAYWGY